MTLREGDSYAGDLHYWLEDIKLLREFAGDERYPEFSEAFRIALANARRCATLYSQRYGEGIADKFKLDAQPDTRKEGR